MPAFPLGLVTGSVSVKIAQQYAPLRLDFGRARRIVVARAVEVYALRSFRTKLGPIPRQSRFAHRRKLHMAVTREVGDFRLDDLARAHWRHGPEQRDDSNKLDSSEMVFFILLTSFLS